GTAGVKPARAVAHGPPDMVADFRRSLGRIDEDRPFVIVANVRFAAPGDEVDGAKRDRRLLPGAIENPGADPGVRHRGLDSGADARVAKEAHAVDRIARISAGID